MTVLSAEETADPVVRSVVNGPDDSFYADHPEGIAALESSVAALRNAFAVGGG